MKVPLSSSAAVLYLVFLSFAARLAIASQEVFTELGASASTMRLSKNATRPLSHTLLAILSASSCGRPLLSFAQRDSYSREVRKVDLQFDHVISYNAYVEFGSTSTRPTVSVRRELTLQIEVNVTCYHMGINLMDVSAVTIFLATVVLPWWWVS